MTDVSEVDSQEVQDTLLTHIILPRFLPQQKPRFYHELDLMSRIVDTVENLDEWIPSKTVELMQKLRRVHFECTPQVISEEINALRPGDTFAMFVRRQNCAFMIHKPSNGMVKVEDEIASNVIVATFPGNLHPGEIYKHDSDIEVNFQYFQKKIADLLNTFIFFGFSLLIQRKR